MIDNSTHLKRERPYLLLFIVQFLFAFNPVAAKWAFLGLTPFSVLALRIFVGALAMQLITRFFLGRWLGFFWQKKEHLQLALLGFLGVVANQGLFLAGISRTSAVNASLIMAAIPALSLAMAILFGQEVFSRRNMASVLLAFGGVAVLMLRRGDFSGARFGDLLLIANATSYSLYLVLAKPILARHHPLAVMTGVFYWSALELLLISFMTQGFDFPSAMPPRAWLGLGILVLGGTVLTYSLNALALRRVDSSLAAFFTFLQPLLGAGLALFFLGEQITLHHFLAFVAVLMALFLRMGWWKKPRLKPSKSI